MPTIARSFLVTPNLGKAKSKNGTSNKNKLKISPPGNNEQDLQEIYIPPNPKINDIDHNHDDPHDKDSSDDTHSKLQERSPSEEESNESEERKSFKSMESEDSSSEKEKLEQSSSDEESEEEELRDELKPEEESYDNEKSSSSHSRGGGSIPSNEKSREGSNCSDETSSESESDENPFKSDDERVGPSQPRRSTRKRCPVIKYSSAYGDKPPIEIEKHIIRSDKAWEKAVDPKAKIVLK